jgi:hypothetical protein
VRYRCEEHGPWRGAVRFDQPHLSAEWLLCTRMQVCSLACLPADPRASRQRFPPDACPPYASPPPQPAMRPPRTALPLQRGRVRHYGTGRRLVGKVHAADLLHTSDGLACGTVWGRNSVARQVWGRAEASRNLSQQESCEWCRQLSQSESHLSSRARSRLGGAAGQYRCMWSLDVPHLCTALHTAPCTAPQHRTVCPPPAPPPPAAPPPCGTGSGKRVGRQAGREAGSDIWGTRRQPELNYGAGHARGRDAGKGAAGVALAACLLPCPSQSKQLHPHNHAHAPPGTCNSNSQCRPAPAALWKKRPPEHSGAAGAGCFRVSGPRLDVSAGQGAHIPHTGAGRACRWVG